MKISTSTLAKPLAFTVAAGLLVALPACTSANSPAAPPPTSAASSEPTAPAPPSATPSDAPSESASPSAAPTSASPAPSSASPAAPAAGNTALLAAGKLALREVSGGTVASIESERTGWEVHVVTRSGAERELRTDAAGTRLVSGPTDDRPDAEDRAENQRFARVDVDYRRAVAVIEREIDGRVDELNLDRENRRTVWEADVSVGSQQRTVQIDASSAQVISNRIDD